MLLRRGPNLRIHVRIYSAVEQSMHEYVGERHSQGAPTPRPFQSLHRRIVALFFFLNGIRETATFLQWKFRGRNKWVQGVGRGGNDENTIGY